MKFVGLVLMICFSTAIAEYVEGFMNTFDIEGLFGAECRKKHGADMYGTFIEHQGDPKMNCAMACMFNEYAKLFPMDKKLYGVFGNNIADWKLDMITTCIDEAGGDDCLLNKCLDNYSKRITLDRLILA